ncbi:MAG: hypothetical protein ACX93O_12090 [Flagellimonas sp.]
MRKGKTAMKLLATTSLGMGLVIILFLSSERQVHRNNAFTRRFPPHPVNKQYDLNLGFNSYYIAGLFQNQLYLGNRTAPWHLLKINLDTRDTSHIQLVPSSPKLQYRSLKVNVVPPYFFMMDGTMPLILRGNIGEWKAKPWMEGEAYFNKALVVDTNKILIRTIETKSQKSTLGLIEKHKGFQVRLDTSLLRRQGSGLFEMDGIPIAGSGTGHMGYVHYYRNEFLTMDLNMELVLRQRTIDTVQQAQIKVAQMDQKRNFQMSAPPTIINKAAAMNKDLVLIRSDRLGLNESLDMLDQATIIDVYHTSKRTYEFSFYLYNINRHKVREFAIQNEQLIGLADDKLIVCTMEPQYFRTKSADNRPTNQKKIKKSTGP